MTEDKKEIYYLKSKNGYIVSSFEVINKTKANLIGICRNVTGWDSETQEPCDYEYFAEINLKWDACTHWWFKGEDYTDDIENCETEAYYHLCGSESFVQYIRAMCFVWKLASEVILRSWIECFNETNEISNLIQLMLDEYEIEKGE